LTEREYNIMMIAYEKRKKEGRFFPAFRDFNSRVN